MVCYEMVDTLVRGSDIHRGGLKVHESLLGTVDVSMSLAITTTGGDWAKPPATAGDRFALGSGTEIIL